MSGEDSEKHDSAEADDHAEISKIDQNDSNIANDSDDRFRESRENSSTTIQEQSGEDMPDLEQTTTNSSKPMPVVKIPRNERSGLFGRFTMVYEAKEPKDYPRKVKWLITFWIGMAAVTAPLGSSIILPTLTEITHDFGTTATIANLSVALYMLSMSVFPLWWSSFSETAGRRTVYVVSFTFYTIFNILAAESDSIGMFIAFRFLSGGTSASVQAVGAGTVADIWDVHERGRAMGIFYLGPLAGPLIAPLIGGALTEGLGWRSTQWFQVIYGVVMMGGIITCLPETHHRKSITEMVESSRTNEQQDLEKGEASRPPSRPPLSRTSSRRSVAAVKTKKVASFLNQLFIEPLKIIKYLRFPAVALTIYYASIAFGSLYFLNISVEKTFSSPPYNFSPILVGCLYISNSTGYFVTSILGGKWVDKIMAREARKAGRVDRRGKLIYRPEDRMRENAWVGAVMMPAALIWYGWTSEKHVYWFAPILANFFFGAGSMLIFGMATTMLTELMPKKASNGVALNNFVRNIFSFAGSFLAEPIINAIGNGWLFTILGIVALLSSVVIIIMKKWGNKFREQMDREMD